MSDPGFPFDAVSCTAAGEPAGPRSWSGASPVFTSGHDEGADMMVGLDGLEVSFRCRLYTLIYFVAMYLAREVTWVIASAFL